MAFLDNIQTNWNFNVPDKFCNACKPFAYDQEEGAKVFAIVELIVSSYNLLNSIFMMHAGIQMAQLEIEMTNKDKFLMAMLFTMSVFLFIQSVLGPLLYFLGWKFKNTLICWLWIIVGCINVICVFLLTIASMLVEDHNRQLCFCCFLYLYYIAYGVWIVLSFVKTRIKPSHDLEIHDPHHHHNINTQKGKKWAPHGKGVVAVSSKSSVTSTASKASTMSSKFNMSSAKGKK